MAMMCLLACSTASAATIGVLVDSEHGPVSAPGVEATVWHALAERWSHEALLLDGRLEDASRQLRSHELTTLLHVTVSWRRQVVHLGDGMVAAPLAPDVHIDEHVMGKHGLRLLRSWDTVGAAAVYRLQEEEDVVSYPEVSLQEAAYVAVGSAQPPVWVERRRRTTIPVVIAADEEYRSFYGERWRAEAQRRVTRASRLLGQAGFALDIRGWQAWESPDEASDLSAILEAQAAVPRHSGPSASIRGHLRIGFTQQTQLADVPVDVEDVGRAFLPGTEVLVADQAAPPGHLRAWDRAEEGVAVAHEVLHALGAPHLDVPGYLMSGSKTSLVARMAPSTRRLAETAAQVRWAHWDPEAALTALETTAAELLYADVDLQVDYVSENLAAGPGVPPPFSLEPNRMSALANVALGRYYFRLAHQGRDDGDVHRESALAHTRAALRMAPTSAAAVALAGALEREQLAEASRAD